MRFNRFNRLERRLKRQVLRYFAILLKSGREIFFFSLGVRAKSGYGCGQSREASLLCLGLVGLVISKITQDLY